MYTKNISFDCGWRNHKLLSSRLYAFMKTQKINAKELGEKIGIPYMVISYIKNAAGNPKKDNHLIFNDYGPEIVKRIYCYYGVNILDIPENIPNRRVDLQPIGVIKSYTNSLVYAVESYVGSFKNRFAKEEGFTVSYANPEKSILNQIETLENNKKDIEAIKDELVYIKKSLLTIIDGIETSIETEIQSISDNINSIKQLQEQKTE